MFLLTIAITALSLGIGIAFCRLFAIVPSLVPTQTQLDPAPIIDVIVPARNEQLDIERSLRSLLAQQNVDIHITVVNDHSSDATASIVDAIAAGDARVTVIHNPPLAEGWFGKANAMHQAYLCTTRPIVVFADADVIHSPSCFATAYDHMQQQRSDFLSLFPRVELVSFWENVLVPHLMVFGLVSYLNRKLHDPKCANAVAAGAFMMTRRDLLSQIDGLSTVRSEALDDVMLARNIKAKGFVTQIVFAPQLLRVRLFKSNHDAYWGFTKNILGAVKHVALAFPAMFVPVLVYGIPMTAMVMGMHHSDVTLVVAGVIAYASQATVLLLARRLADIRFLKAIAFPLAAFPIACCLARAIYHHLTSGGVAWRGRVVRKA
ncbi:GalNAc(5)-diNAcBac-PP-undecaprenol beta-1,3-glucosyltransferase [Novipirellula galeiformis]|uniref:GalNAc(5)-diNAcBac-PP-undecaprenol beta-1,3-glucosyltransferase n=1 Tax=Novipirellula galeiformis TaxID=2528004 RepID=A0A5C6C317_9BACT|nr:glycosyltransferase family 2 protein [Novipirellula galeiformis]TWU17249.1 GalNAc(5)-diNAcBac-PP-undecaprenol beta-1,3-glucosyltransferase [Novipirellula galeiformis]